MAKTASSPKQDDDRRPEWRLAGRGLIDFRERPSPSSLDGEPGFSLGQGKLVLSSAMPGRLPPPGFRQGRSERVEVGPGPAAVGDGPSGHPSEGILRRHAEAKAPGLQWFPWPRRCGSGSPHRRFPSAAEPRCSAIGVERGAMRAVKRDRQKTGSARGGRRCSHGLRAGDGVSSIVTWGASRSAGAGRHARVRTSWCRR